METITINKSNAIKAYKEADEKNKSFLLNLVGGKEVLFPDITQRVNSFLSACEITGDNPNEPKFNSGDDDDWAYQRLKVIAKALREGVKLSYANSNQQKWFPWHVWDNERSGFRFDDALCDYPGTDSYGGSRLGVDTKEKAIYFGSHPEFLELWNKFLK